MKELLNGLWIIAADWQIWVKVLVIRLVWSEPAGQDGDKCVIGRGMMALLDFVAVCAEGLLGKTVFLQQIADIGVMCSFVGRLSKRDDDAV
jgi:hypothetical protein